MLNVLLDDSEIHLPTGEAGKAFPLLPAVCLSLVSL